MRLALWGYRRGDGQARHLTEQELADIPQFEEIREEELADATT